MEDRVQYRFRNWILVTGIILASFYLLGMVFPEPFWATNNPGLLPLPWKVIFFLVAALLISTPFWWQEKWSLDEMDQSRTMKNTGFCLVAIGIGFLYSQFPMALDQYGDAYFIRQAIDISIPEWDNRLITEPLKPDWLNTKVGLRTFYELNNFMAWLFGANGVEVARVLGFITGGLFAFLWLKFVDQNLKGTGAGWKGLFILVGLSAPLTQVFMGHYETYAYSYTGILIWVSAIALTIKTGNKKLFWSLPFIFLIVLQTHILNWLLLPMLGMTAVWFFRDKVELGLIKRLDRALQKRFPRYQGGLTWSGLLVYFFVPMVVMGSIAYFFIFANHNGPRKFSIEEFENTLFLPLYTDEAAPYDRYNLFSPAHFVDYLNLLFLWSGAILLLLVPPLTFLRKKVPWNDPLVLVMGSTSLIMTLLFFVLNPLLGASIDWDLFITPVLVVLPFLVVVYAHLAKEIKLRMLAGPVLGLALLSSTFMVVNSSQTMQSQRYLHLGQWNFKTYWINSSSGLLAGVFLGDGPVEQQRLRDMILDKLESHATLGNDREYANVLVASGEYFRKELKDNQKALSYFTRAEKYSPLMGKNIYYLAIIHFEEGNYPASFQNAKKLVELNYQPYKRSLKIGIHTALAAREYQAAADWAVTYLYRWQDDPVIAETERRLRTGESVETIVNLFGH